MTSTPNQRHNAGRLASICRDMIRLRDPATGRYLHLSGSGSTQGTDWAWLGHRLQADTMRQRAMTRGEPWPWQPIHRDQCDAAPATQEAEA